MFHWLNSLLHWFRPADAGAEGEALAADFLRRERGFRLVARNWRNPRDRRDEIDLIGRIDGVLVFVEVKARSADALVPGYYAVNARKKRILLRTCMAYLKQLRPAVATFRFDVVEVSLAPKDATGRASAPEILHFENVPLFPKHFRGGR